MRWVLAGIGAIGGTLYGVLPISEDEVCKTDVIDYFCERGASILGTTYSKPVATAIWAVGLALLGFLVGTLLSSRADATLPSWERSSGTS